jgi:hypothetical protein
MKKPRQKPANLTVLERPSIAAIQVGFVETIRQMDKVLIARIGMEGVGVTIFGKKSESAWLFWTEGVSIDLDENDEELWRSWSSQPVSSLDLALPSEWPLFHPV